MSERLKPIEKPEKLMTKIGYWYSQKMFGKVITPLKKLYSRLPVGFAMWSNKMHKLETQLPISAELRLLLRIHVAQLNTCHFCIDIAQARAMQQFQNQDKFFNVSDFATSPLFDQAEKAALRFATEQTLQKNVSDETYNAAKNHYSDEQLIAIAWMVMSEHVYNLMNLPFHIESDGLCQVKPKQAPATVA